VPAQLHLHGVWPQTSASMLAYLQQRLPAGRMTRTRPACRREVGVCKNGARLAILCRLPKAFLAHRPPRAPCRFLAHAQAYEHSTALQQAGFDNVLLSMLTVFQCMTLNGWVYSMYRCV
jgi:hypothetical protein